MHVRDGVPSEGLPGTDGGARTIDRALRGRSCRASACPRRPLSPSRARIPRNFRGRRPGKRGPDPSGTHRRFPSRSDHNGEEGHFIGLFRGKNGLNHNRFAQIITHGDLQGICSVGKNSRKFRPFPFPLTCYIYGSTPRIGRESRSARFPSPDARGRRPWPRRRAGTRQRRRRSLLPRGHRRRPRRRPRRRHRPRQAKAGRTQGRRQEGGRGPDQADGDARASCSRGSAVPRPATSPRRRPSSGPSMRCSRPS